MHKPLLCALFLCLLTVPAAAQTAAATGTGVGIASSKSQSGAVAIAGQGGQGGNSSLTVNSANPAVTTANVNQNLTGTSTVKNVPAVFAPGLSAAGLETCLGSVSGGGAAVGFGASFGTTVPDPGCNARLDARTLWSMGLKGAAIARLCIEPSGAVYRSMPDICARYTPAAPGGPAPIVLATGGAIEVVDGRTGVTRSCDDYNSVRQKCLQWTGEPRIKIAARKPVAKPLAAAPGVAAINAAAPVAAKPPEPKKED